MQGVGETRFHFARPLGPFRRVLQPIDAVGDVRPAANPGETIGERFDIAIDVIQASDLGSEPFVGHVTALADVAEEPANHPGMRRIGHAQPVPSRRHPIPDSGLGRASGQH